MSAITWGMLAKSSEDSETIEEAIARLIDEHNDDETSHLATGQSLQSHKAAEIIDHLARSVYRDKLAFDRFQIDEHFSTIDAWTKTSGVTLPKISEMELLTTAVNNNQQTAQISYGDSTYDQETFEQNPVLETRVKLAESTNVEFYICIGDMDDVHAYGFYYHGSKLYAAYYDVDEVLQEVEITGIDITKYHTYRIDLSDGVNAVWYIDDVQKRSVAYIDTSAKGNYCKFSVKTKTTSTKTMWVQSVHYDEDYLTN